MLQQASIPQPRLSNRRGRRRPLISLTPLIDVVFILLVFFMLASSFLDWRAIDLDTPARTASQTSLEGAILVEVRRDGLRLSGRPVERAQLASQVAERLETRPDRPVLVKPADGIVLQETVDVLDRLTAAGVTDLSLIRGPAG